MGAVAKITVALDLGGMQVEDLLCFLRAAHFPYRPATYAHQPDWLQQIADQIEAQTKPPRIPEPGLWGVVEAGTLCGRGPMKWVRMLDSGPDQQWGNDEGDWAEWSDLIDPTLIRPGIEDAR